MFVDPYVAITDFGISDSNVYVIFSDIDVTLILKI